MTGFFRRNWTFSVPVIRLNLIDTYLGAIHVLGFMNQDDARFSHNLRPLFSVPELLGNRANEGLTYQECDR
jgi:hypothetical protein